MTRSDTPYSAKKFRAAFAFFVFGKAAQALAMIAFTLLSIRLLSTREFAAYMVFFGLVELARPLVSLGLVPMMQQFLPEIAMRGTKSELRSFLRWSLASRILLTMAVALACLLGWQWLSAWLGLDGPEVLPIGLVCGVIVATLVADYSVTALESLLQQQLAQPIRALLPLGKILGLLVLFWSGHLDLVTLLKVELGIAILCALAGEFAVARVVSRLQPDGGLKVDLRSMLTFAWHMSGAQALATMSNPGLIRLIATRALGLDAMAPFAFLQQLVLYATRFMPSVQFANLVRPMLVARQSLGAGAVVSSAGGLLWKMNVMAALVIIGVVTVGGENLFRALSGLSIEGGGWAFAAMMLIPPLMAQENLASTLLQVYRRASVVRTLNLLAAIAPVAVVLLASQFGLVGAAIGLAAGIGVQSVATLWVVSRTDSGIAIDLTGAFRSGILAVTVAGALVVAGTAFDLPSAYTLIGSVALFLITYAVLLVHVAPPLAEGEFALIERLMPRRSAWLRLFVQRAH